jgi:hypothetical protein
MSTRNKWLIAIVAVIGITLLVCIGLAAFGVISFLLSGGADIPYPDGPPPTPSVQP